MRILKDIHEVKDVKALWEAITLSSNSSTIFQTWGWNYYWLKFLQGDKDIYIMLDTKIDSLAPFYRRRWKDLQILDLIGTRGSDYLDIICSESNYLEFFYRVLEHFLRSNLDIINLEDFGENPFKTALIEEAVKEFKIYSVGVNWCSTNFIDLSFAYKDSVSSKVLRGYRSRRRKLLNDYGEYSVVDGKTNDLDSHYNLHQKKFQTSWSKGSYSSYKTTAFMSKVCSYLCENGLLHYKVLLLNGKHTNSILGGKINNKVYIYTSAFDPILSYYSLGKMLYIEDIIKSEIEGIERYDLMRGNEKYKKELGCKESQNKKIIIAKNEEDINKYLSYYKEFSEGFNFAPSLF